MSSGCFHPVIHSIVWQLKSGDELVSVETGYLRTWDAGEGSEKVRGSTPADAFGLFSFSSS